MTRVGPRPLAAAIVLLLLLTATPAEARWWHHHRQPVRPPVCEDTARVLLIGDSITEGGGASDLASTSWAAILEANLPGHEILNAGCGGATSSDLVGMVPGAARLCLAGTQWLSMVEPRLPADVAIIAFGTNDSVGLSEPAPIEPWLYEQNIRDAVGLLGGPVILMTPPKWRGARDAVNADYRLRAYTDALHRIAEDTLWVEVVDVYSLLEPDDFKWFWWLFWRLRDIHPNDSGHAKIAVALEPVILALLPDKEMAPLLPCTKRGWRLLDDERGSR